MSGSDFGWGIFRKRLSKEKANARGFLAAFAHWRLCSVGGFRCLGTGERFEGVRNHTPDEDLPDEWQGGKEAMRYIDAAGSKNRFVLRSVEVDQPNGNNVIAMTLSRASDLNTSAVTIEADKMFHKDGSVDGELEWAKKVDKLWQHFNVGQPAAGNQSLNSDGPCFRPQPNPSYPPPPPFGPPFMPPQPRPKGPDPFPHPDAFKSCHKKK